MLKTYGNRQEESTKRIWLRNQSHTFQHIIEKGTNCSSFEASVITEKAQEVFHLGEAHQQGSLHSGQMVWRAIDENEPPGKPLEECLFKEIRLTIHKLDEDQEVRKTHGLSAKRGQQIARMTAEAFDQETLLTQEDLAMLLDTDIRTIRKDIQRFQKQYKILIPTRGNKKDIGPGVTHREKAVTLYIQGKNAVEIAREMQHSLKAVERYIHTFCRTIFAQQQNQNTLKTALIVGISVSLVNRYLELRDKYMKTHAYQERLEEIERCGTQFWEMVDFKKKVGWKQRRGI